MIGPEPIACLMHQRSRGNRRLLACSRNHASAGHAAMTLHELPEQHAVRAGTPRQAPRGHQQPLSLDRGVLLLWIYQLRTGFPQPSPGKREPSNQAHLVPRGLLGNLFQYHSQIAAVLHGGQIPVRVPPCALLLRQLSPQTHALAVSMNNHWFSARAYAVPPTSLETSSLNQLVLASHQRESLSPCRHLGTRVYSSQ